MDWRSHRQSDALSGRSTARRRVRAALVAMALGLGLGLGAPVRAQEPGEAGEDAEASEDVEASVRLFEEGVAHLRAGHFDEAARAFRASYRIERRVATMCNLAVTYDRWGPDHRAQAIRAYRSCALDDPSGRFSSYAQRRAGELERELALAESETDEVGSAGDEVDDARDDTTEPRTDGDAPDDGTERSPEAGVEGRRVEGQLEAQPPGPLDDPSPSSGRRLLVGGIACGAVAAGAAATAVALALSAQDRADALSADLGGAPIVRGSPEDQRLDDARRRSKAALGLYLGAGLLGATAVALVIAALAGGDDEPAAAAFIAPSRDGLTAGVSARF